VTTGDGVYTVLAGSSICFIDGFDTTGMSGTVTAAVLHLQYGTQGGYGGTNYVRYALDSQPLQDTTILPVDTADGWSADQTFDLLGAIPGLTLAQISTLDIEFTNNDGPPNDDLSFDYIWITVTYSGVVDYSLNVSYVLDHTNIGDYSNYVLEVRANYSGASAEEFNITYQIDGAGAWYVLGYINSVTEQVFTTTLPTTPFINVTVRIVDNTTGATPAANTIRIDFIELYCTN
jgi:hypothetical protein